MGEALRGRGTNGKGGKADRCRVTVGVQAQGGKEAFGNAGAGPLGGLGVPDERDGATACGVAGGAAGLGDDGGEPGLAAGPVVVLVVLAVVRAGGVEGRSRTRNGLFKEQRHVDGRVDLLWAGVQSTIAN